MIKAIETQYNGYRFRSRLEARWAVFFDALGIPWEYEYEGFDLGNNLYYLPDFRLNKIVWVEIKGQNPNDVELLKIEKLCKGGEIPALIIFGVPGDEQGVVYNPPDNEWIKNDHRDTRLIWCHLSLCKEYAKIPYPDKEFGRATHLHTANCMNLHHAYAAARSARFEHGETPRVLRGRQNAH